MKVNTNGASKGNPSLATGGAAIRDSAGSWLTGFAVNLGVCSSVVAEIWALFYIPQLAWDSGCRRVIVELDFAIGL